MLRTGNQLYCVFPESPSKCCNVQVRIPKVNCSLPGETGFCLLVSCRAFRSRTWACPRSHRKRVVCPAWLPLKTHIFPGVFCLSVWKRVTERCLQAADISLCCFSKNVHAGRTQWDKLWCCLKEEHQPWLFSVVSDTGSRDYSSQGKGFASSLTQLIQAKVCLGIAVRPGSLCLYCLNSFQCLVVTKKTGKGSIHMMAYDKEKCGAEEDTFLEKNWRLGEINRAWFCYLCWVQQHKPQVYNF